MRQRFEKRAHRRVFIREVNGGTHQQMKHRCPSAVFFLERTDSPEPFPQTFPGEYFR